MKWLNINKKRLINEEANNKADNKIKKKVYLECLGLKHKVISG